MQLTPILVSLALAVTVLAAPAAVLKRQSGGAECGSHDYSGSAVSAAANAACGNLESGDAPGGYPHEYHDYEDFTFSTDSPWYEFPILSSGKIYTGGSPGADRVVIINGDCELTAVLTHTGASGNNFNECGY